MEKWWIISVGFLWCFLFFFVALQLEIKSNNNETKQWKHFRREMIFGVMIT